MCDSGRKANSCAKLSIHPSELVNFSQLLTAVFTIAKLTAVGKTTYRTCVFRSRWWYRILAGLLAAAGYNGLIFSEAKKAAEVSGKPLLNVGCKQAYTETSDINLDIVSRNVPRFMHGDIQNLNMFGYKQFGAVYASHVLEHIEDPDTALRELHRVAEKVFVITPLPIWPWAWLHPDHKWILWRTRKVCRVPHFLRLGLTKITVVLTKFMSPKRSKPRLSEQRTKT